MTTLNEALLDIAVTFGLDPDELVAYANEDTIDGFTFGDDWKWPGGSVWGVEGQVLYALVRATKPQNALELGTWYGCSATHIATALKKNADGGKLTCVDNDTFDKLLMPKTLQKSVHFEQREILSYLAELPARKLDFVFVDFNQTTQVIKEVWSILLAKCKKGTMILNHDTHNQYGLGVRQGIADAGVKDFKTYLITPSDCGLACWRKS
jgi:hypothetical protein